MSRPMWLFADTRLSHFGLTCMHIDQSGCQFGLNISRKLVPNVASIS